MASVVSGVMRRSSLLSQLSSVLRHSSNPCSSLHHISPPAFRVVRLFHGSPTLPIRKPNKAVVNPRQKPRKEPQASPPQKKLNIPFRPHSPTTTTTLPSSRLEQLQASQPPPIPALTQPLHVPPPGTPIPTRAAPPPAIHYQDTISKLALSSEPTILYTTTYTRTFTVVSILGAIFIATFAGFNAVEIPFGLTTGNNTLVAAGIVILSFGAIFCTYILLGPYNLIKQLTALPAKVPAGRTAAYLGNTAKPTLRIEPFRYGLGIWPKPFEVSLAEAHTDRPVTIELLRLAGQREEEYTPGTLGKMNTWRLRLWKAYMKMLFRGQSFVYLRVDGVGNFKLDMLDGVLAGEGRVLDQVVKVDTKPGNVFATFSRRR